MTQAARIGLLADTHCHGPHASDLPAAVLECFRGVDLIVHLGDMGGGAVLDRLQTVAPVLATRGMDDPPDDPRIAPSTRVIEVGGLAIGALFDLGRSGIAVMNEGRPTFAEASLDEVLRAAFGRPVDVVAFGGTHQELVAHREGVLFVNPGSPTLPAHADGRKTVAVLEIRERVATVEITRL
jgi:putative phosphoesterase